MSESNHSAAPSDARLLCGVTGELTYKKIFPARYAMHKRRTLKGLTDYQGHLFAPPAIPGQTSSSRNGALPAFLGTWHKG